MRRTTILCIMSAVLLGVAAPTSGQVFDEDFKLLASDGAGGDSFGKSIAIDNGIVVAGSNADGGNGFRSGSAYLFDAFTGVQIAKLVASDGVAYDIFSWHIAIDNGVVAVSALGEIGNSWKIGSVYLFDISDPQDPIQIAKLLPSDGVLEDQFGSSIAIDNGILAIGSRRDFDNGFQSGSAYLFDISDPQNPIQITKFLPSDGADFDGFGDSIAIGNGVVAVGAQFADTNGNSSGSAYLFDISDPQNPIQIAKLLPSDGAAGDRFGSSIAIDNGVVAVGAQMDTDNGNRSGSAYLFDISDPQNPIQIAKLLPSDGAVLDEFGFSIAIDNGVVAVGAYGDDDDGYATGSAYIFHASTGAQIAKLLASDGAGGDSFGGSIAIDNDIVAVGASRGDGDNSINTGSVYLFDAFPPDPEPDELTLDLIDDVLDLNLQNGIENNLDAKLDAVVHALDDMNENNDGAACNALQAFINSVQAQSGNHIPVEDADALIAAAEEVREVLGCE